MDVRPRPNVCNLDVYVPGKPIEEVQLELGLTRVIKLASNENPWGPSPKALEAGRLALDKIFLYPDANAYNLKKALSERVQVEPSQIAIGNGSDEIVQLIANVFVDPGDEVVMANPSFPRYKTVTELMGGIPKEVVLTDYRHDLAAMAAAVTEKTKLVFICNPNNPSGTIVSERELDEFMDLIPPRVMVVFDEAYIEYVNAPEFASGLKYLQQGREVLVLRTFSKAYGLAGLRIGFAIGSPEMIDLLNRVRGPFNGNQVAQQAAGAALADQDYLGQVVANNYHGLNQLSEGLAKLGCTPVPSQTNFILVEVGRPSAELFAGLMRKGIIVRPGHLLGHPEALRVTVGTGEENEQFLAALADILNA
jgi:histidinol-phosphate aminotransferase